MTTDQPRWMKDVAAAHAARRLPPKVSAYQPTHTSSLEEARRRVERAWYLYDGCVDRDEVEAAVKAFARAEVIREVEAALSEQFGIGHTEDHMRCEGVEFDPAHCGLCRVEVRALSQGGEGKSDG